MGYERVTERPSVVYHYTKRENLPDILKDGRIKRMGKPYYKVGGRLARYPKFIPSDYIILKLTPRWQSGEWVRWIQELPPGADLQLREAAEAFSMKKVGFRDDMKFCPSPEILECAQLLRLSQSEMAQEQEQTM